MRKLLMFLVFILFATPAFANENVCIRNQTTKTSFKVNINGGDHTYAPGGSDCVAIATGSGIRFVFNALRPGGGYVYLMWADFFNPTVGSGGWKGIQAGRNFCTGEVCLFFNGESSGSMWYLEIKDEPANQGPTGG
jgi:hypothetical protein